MQACMIRWIVCIASSTALESTCLKTQVLLLMMAWNQELDIIIFLALHACLVACLLACLLAEFGNPPGLGKPTVRV